MVNKTEARIPCEQFSIALKTVTPRCHAEKGRQKRVVVVNLLWLKRFLEDESSWLGHFNLSLSLCEVENIVTSVMSPFAMPLIEMGQWGKCEWLAHKNKYRKVKHVGKLHSVIAAKVVETGSVRLSFRLFVRLFDLRKETLQSLTEPRISFQSSK